MDILLCSLAYVPLPTSFLRSGYDQVYLKGAIHVWKSKNIPITDYYPMSMSFLWENTCNTTLKCLKWYYLSKTCWYIWGYIGILNTKKSILEIYWEYVSKPYICGTSIPKIYWLKFWAPRGLNLTGVFIHIVKIRLPIIILLSWFNINWIDWIPN